jgi:hypothetical protein
MQVAVEHVTDCGLIVGNDAIVGMGLFGYLSYPQ